MTTLIIGTLNPAKISQIKSALLSLKINIQGLPTDQQFPHVIEDGSTALENAHKKALTYSQFLSSPVLSMDNALYFDGLPPEQQPGLQVRRIPGSTARISDEEMLDYYLNLITKLGGKINGHWEFGICMAKPDGTTHETTILSSRLFVNTPSETMITGYPLESLSIIPETGKYIAEMSPAEQDQFWQESIGKELCEFVKKAF